MKSLGTFFLMLFCIVTQVQCQDREPFLIKSFSGESIKELYARTSGGSITVEGGNDQARVEVYIRGNNGRDLSKSEIETRLKEDYDLTVKLEGNELNVTAEPKSKFFNWKNALSISFRVYVPKSISTDLGTSGGSIKLKNLSGTQNFSTSGGSLNIDRLSGRIKGQTSGGSIEVSNTKDQIDLSTSGGSIKADNCAGTITLSTSGGSIRLVGLQGSTKAVTSGGPIHGSDIQGELEAHTSGGSVNLERLACSVDASTSGGSMDIEVDKLGKFVTVKNSGGNIRVTLPRNTGLDLRLRGDRINLENMDNFSGNKEDHKVDGKINGGGIPVNINTSGRVTVALN